MDHSQFQESSVWRLLLKFSIPAIVGMLVNALYTVVDRFFIGKMPGVGAVALSGVGAAFPVTIVIMSFAMLVGIGAGSRISIALGAGREERAAKILGNAFAMNIVFSLILTALGLLFYKPILVAFGATASTMEYAQEYIVIIISGIIFTNTAFAMNNCIRSLGFPKIGMMTLLLGAGINIILDPIFIFGLDLGVKGAGYATITAQIVSSAWTIYFLTGKRVNIPLKIKNMKLDFGILLNIFSIGMSPFAMQLAAALIQILFNNNLNTYAGELGIGVFSSINSIIMLFFMPIFGINQGAQPIIGYFYGARDYAKVRTTYVLAAISATVLATAGFLACQFAPQILLGIFNKDAGFLELGIYGIRIFTAMLPIVGFQIVSANFYQAIGEASTAMFLSLSRQVIMLIPLILILPRYFGLLGVWVSTPIADILASILTAVFIIRTFRKLSVMERELPV